MVAMIKFKWRYLCHWSLPSLSKGYKKENPVSQTKSHQKILSEAGYDVAMFILRLIAKI